MSTHQRKRDDARLMDELAAMMDFEQTDAAYHYRRQVRKIPQATIRAMRGTEFRFRETYLSRAIGSLSTWVCEP